MKCCAPLSAITFKQETPVATPTSKAPTSSPSAQATADSRLVQDVSRQTARRVVGQDYMVERLLISLLTGGHVLLEGVCVR